MDLIICNPPWIPVIDTEDEDHQSVESWLDSAVYDRNSEFLQTFLRQARNYLLINETMEKNTTNTNKLLQVDWIRWDYSICSNDMLIQGDCFPFYDSDGILFTIGYMIVILVFLPMALMDLKVR